MQQLHAKRRLLGLALVATAALTLGGACGPKGPAPASAGLGQACKRDTVCAAGLVCKAAVCKPAQSVAGDVCVTDAGCAEGLRCVSGHCASGRATREECEASCDHVRDIVTMTARAEMGGALDETDAVAILALANDVGDRCLGKCLDRGTHEGAACRMAVATLDGLERCP